MIILSGGFHFGAVACHRLWAPASHLNDFYGDPRAVVLFPRRRSRPCLHWYPQAVCPRLNSSVSNFGLLSSYLGYKIRPGHGRSGLGFSLGL